MAQYSSILVLQRKKLTIGLARILCVHRYYRPVSVTFKLSSRPKYTRPQVTIVKHPHFYLICHKKFSYAHVLTLISVVCSKKKERKKKVVNLPFVISYKT